jgi:CBS domain containing-hemolysin-like protein
VSSDVAWLVALGIVLVAMSAFLTATEVALFSLRRVDREQMARSGKKRDEIVLHLLEKPRRLIMTVSVANDAVNAGLTVTALAAIERAMIAQSVWACVWITVAVVLPSVVLVGEVLPRLAAQKAPMAWARAAARPLWLLWYAATPVRWVVHGAADFVLLPFGDLGKGRPGDLSEEEFRKLVDAGSAQGQVDQRERRLIHRVFEFGDKTVGQIMTPRDKVFALSYDLPMARMVKEVASRGFSRVPIYTRSLDNIRGILNAKDLVLHATGQPVTTRPLAELLHEPLFVPRTTQVKRLFRIFKQKKVHIAIVVNEYGKLLGLVTMDDVLEQLFGDIRDEREGLQSAIRRPRPQPGYMKTPVPPGDEPLYSDVTPPPQEVPLPPPSVEKEVAGRGDASDDGSPVPIIDVATGPSGPVEMPRQRGDRGIDR